ncbi:hypothetical protein TRVA0_056S00474 [Trichomonascus vanleenenianus]|uniref:uncharacterized protein n=1 Tax=Trichomonascus vanleenenianus TaxID=2268995 RepID=UPI003EC9711D
MTKIVDFVTHDFRFPTSLDKTGSDAMNDAGDYSAAYVIIKTDSGEEGHGMTFTIGRGNDIVCSAIKYLCKSIEGLEVEELIGADNIGRTWKRLVSDSQLRWIGPEKGVIHLALGATVNALWDLWAKREKKPVWKLVTEMTPEQIVGAVDWRYMTDALTPEEALKMLKDLEPTKKQRIQDALNNQAVPAYTTSAGWLGYDDEKMKRLLKETLDQGYKHFKLKVGGNVAEDQRRLRIAREVLGYDNDKVLMIDANQVWSVPEAIDYVKQLKEYKPWFIEEPTSPDDIFGHRAIREALKEDGIKVATGEMCQNRVIFKQLIANGAIDIAQVDACRLGGLNEVIAVLLLAAKYKVPVVPHSGGVGLPEYTQHISTIDYILFSGKKSLLEYVDHLHEHFVNPSVVKAGRFVTPTQPGYSVQVKDSALDYEFPNGKWWQSEASAPIKKVII